ncbi:hypothetical protein Bca4012_052907 [Brassica carinata]|uniref:Uncharacterized protein n=1 Tax=Brassica carinata TaxID=52824 RepID=A0A8X7RBS1_BRACI|nr:hypothetical protein Bca52824_055435 [Brassica carinata]
MGGSYPTHSSPSSASLVSFREHRHSLFRLRFRFRGRQPSLLNLSFEHPHPPTKLMFIPPSLRLPSGDLLASSGDFLRFLEIKRLHHRQPRRCPQQVRAVNLLRLE